MTFENGLKLKAAHQRSAINPVGTKIEPYFQELVPTIGKKEIPFHRELITHCSISLLVHLPSLEGDQITNLTFLD